MVRVSSVVIVFFLIIGGISTYFSYPGYRDGVDSENWPTANGTITESYLEFGGSEGTAVTAHVKYQYSVSGIQYQSDRLYPGDVTESVSQSEAQKIVDKYPQGSQVVVYYKPSDHSYSVLEPGLTTGTIIFLVIGIAFLGLAFIIIFITRIIPKLRSSGSDYNSYTYDNAVNVPQEMGPQIYPCKNCGVTNQKGDKFCNGCGKAV
ncbi:MAG: DUF3592 domain-containing protein [Candidatus Kariarchaeaceae archaeon]|jgi:hypothetical protein